MKRYLITVGLLLLLGFGIFRLPSLDHSATSSASINWADIHGVQYRWSPLMTEDNVTNKAPPPSISFPQIEANGWNEIRVFISWSWYEANKTAFLAYLQELATEADNAGLNVVYSPYGTDGLSQSWDFNSFPSNFTSQYANPSAFWNAWLANETEYQGKSGWYLQVQFMKAVIGVVDSHTSTLAYEIMNEPETPNYQYSNLSAYQTYVAQQLRKITSNWIMFMGPYHGGHITYSSSVINSAPSLTISKLVFDGHDYANGGYIPTIAQVTSTLHVPGIVGEFAVCSPYITCPATQSGVNGVISNYMSLFKQYGLGWDYYSWQYGPTDKSGYYNNLLDNSGNEWWIDTILSSQTSTSTNSLTDSTSNSVTSSTHLSSSTTVMSSTTSSSSTTTSSTATTYTTSTSKSTTTISTTSSSSTSSLAITTIPKSQSVGGTIQVSVVGLRANSYYKVSIYDVSTGKIVESFLLPETNSLGDLYFHFLVKSSMLTASGLAGTDRVNILTASGSYAIGASITAIP